MLTVAANINKTAVKIENKEHNCTHKPLYNGLKDSYMKFTIKIL